MIRTVAFLLMAASVPTSAQGNNTEILNQFYKDALPGEAFIATPYGSDSRFKPKTIWLYLENFQANPRKPKRERAWVAASSGEAIYDPVYAPVHSETITLPSSSMDDKVKFGVTASLAGTLDAIDVDAGAALARSKGVDLELVLGTTEIEYVYYVDMLTAQDQNSNALAALNRTLSVRFKRDVPVRRVVTAALRAKGGTIKVSNSRNVDFSTEADLSSFLSKLGFTYDREKNSFNSLTFDDWRYIAYQSIYTDKDGKVSTGGDAQPVGMTAENVAPFDENAFGRSEIQASP